MEKTTMSLGDILSLSQEIGEGLLTEKLSLKTKYWLTRLGDKVNKEVKTFDKLRNELITKLGKKDKEGNLQIAMTIKKGKKDIENPDMLEFKKEIEEVLMSNVELEHAIFNLEDFSEVKSEKNYSLFYKLIKE